MTLSARTIALFGKNYKVSLNELGKMTPNERLKAIRAMQGKPAVVSPEEQADVDARAAGQGIFGSTSFE